MATYKSREMMIKMANNKKMPNTGGNTCITCSGTNNAISSNGANTAMLNNMFIKTLHAEKQKKSATPLSIPPPKTNSDLKGLLLDRINILIEICKKHLQCDDFQLFLFGSQLSGYSRSGEPDIDIWCYYPYGTLQQKYNILKDCDFKLDFSFAQNLKYTANSLKFYPSL